ncbi:hypothetical protein [Pelosinus sp. UFO1]|uniref:hypothetical protein n=1 Tax=Pelosinus sp. UFO1 TaxID=484770 RepID=UPI0004D0E18A|nr:hypothetical protein [Pelosinus sp. UFO1]AIF51826.1 hypothetical protein UFO1_2279 [Pelosinus sp. UFO1]
MSNQTLLWASFVLSWLSVLFLKKTELKRYMPVALFGGLVATIVIEMGITLHWWATKETVFPLVNMPIFNYGSFLIGIIWIFKFTYKRFWLFLATNAVIDFILTGPMDKWLVNRGILELYDITSFQLFLVATGNAIILYWYQLWQEGDASPFQILKFSQNVQPVASKPLKDNED